MKRLSSPMTSATYVAPISLGPHQRLDAFPADHLDQAPQLANVDGDSLELRPRSGEVRIVPRVDVGVLEELKEAILLGRAAREDIS
jgi:hypothetical protein